MPCHACHALPCHALSCRAVLCCALQSGDADFKRLLSSVVDTDCWEVAKKAAAERVSNIDRQLNSTEGVLRSLGGSVARLEGDLAAQLHEEADWQQQQQTQQVCATRE